MHRFFCPSKNISANQIIIDDLGQLHHIRDVLRLRVGSKAVICDEQGIVYNTEIEKIAPEKIILKIKERHGAVNRNQLIQLTIACAIPKKSKLDDIIDKLVQLGVVKVIPLITERVIVRLDKDKVDTRAKRWEKIALSAAQQSKRNSLTVIEPIKEFKKVVESAKDYDFKLIPTLEGKRKSLKEVFSQPQPQPQPQPRSVLVLIGPEGDFSEEEVELAVKNGFVPLSLGKNVLRVETAAVFIVSVMNYLFSTDIHG